MRTVQTAQAIAFGVGLVVMVILIGVLIARVIILRSRVSELESDLDLARRPLLRPGGSPTPISRAGQAVRAVLDTAAQVRVAGMGSFLATSMEDLTRWALDDSTEIDRIAGPDGRVTILFTDIEDSTALNDRLGDRRWVRLISAHERLVRTCVTRHHGHVVKSQGDGFMVVFPSPENAVAAGMDIQAAVSRARHRVHVRIGINCGRAILRDGDYFGRTVAFAARVGAHAAGGEILVSQQVRDLLDGRYDLVDSGEVELKGFGGKHRLWRVA